MPATAARPCFCSVSNRRRCRCPHCSIRPFAIATDHGGRVAARKLVEPGGSDRSGEAEGGSGADLWRNAFLMAPYLRDTFVSCGVLSETFETAVTWDRFEEFHAEVERATREAVAEVCGAAFDGPGSPRVSCRLTHVYPDGAAPYFTVIAPGRPRRRDRAVGRDQAGRLGGDHRFRWHDHSSPRGRPGSPAVVRPPAAGCLRRRARRRQDRTRPDRDAQPRRADRSAPRIPLSSDAPGSRP